MHFHKYKDTEILVPKHVVGIGGQFRMEIVRGDGRAEWLTDWFDNNITDTGMDRMATSSTRFNACVIGTGSAAPTNADTTLQTYVAGTTTKGINGQVSNGSDPSPPNYYSEVYYRYDFAVGTVVGNMAEVGIGTVSTSGTALTARELIRDSGGSPTTISVLVTETLRVHYRFRHWAPTEDALGSFELTGVGTISTTRRASSVGAWALNGSGGLCVLGSAQSRNNIDIFTGTIGAVTSSPGGTKYDATGQSTGAYTNGTYSRSYSATWAAGTGTATIQSTRFPCYDNGNAGNGGFFQTEFSPTFAKGEGQALTLEYNIGWTRHA